VNSACLQAITAQAFGANRSTQSQVRIGWRVF
jgi:hypothetical protein